MSRILLPLAGLLLSSVASGQLHPYFEKTFSETSNEYALDVRLDPTTPGASYIVGLCQSDAAGIDVVVRKFDAQGNVLWGDRYNSLTNGQDIPVDIAVDANGNLFIAGHHMPAPGQADYMVLKYNKTGQRQYALTYDLTVSRADQARGCDLDAAGDLYITGASLAAAPSTVETPDIVTFKISGATGAKVWEQRSDGVGASKSDNAKGIDVTADGVYIGAEIWNAEGDTDAFAVKYDLNGVQKWSHRYDGTGDRLYAQVSDVVAGSNGAIYLAGTHANDLSYASVTAFDSTGLLWIEAFEPSPGRSDVRSIDIAPNGDLAIACRVEHEEVYTASIRLLSGATGVQRWSVPFGGFGTGSSTDIEVNASGDIFVLGKHDADHAVCANLSPTGVLKTTYAHTSATAGAKLFPAKMATAANGSVYIAGARHVGSEPDMLALKFYKGVAAVRTSSPRVVGGQPLTGSVELFERSIGASTVTMTDNSSASAPQGTVGIPNGQTTVAFPITTAAVAADTLVTLTGLLQDGRNDIRTTTFTVTAPRIASLSFLPGSEVYTGSRFTGRVTLSSIAPPNGLSVAISDNTTSLATPPNVVVPGGATAAEFSIMSSPVSDTFDRLVTASLGKGVVNAPVRLYPGLESLSISPADVTGGSSTTGIVRLSGPSRIGGTTVAITDNSGSVTVPSSTVVTQGTSARQFEIGTMPVGATATRLVTITLGTVTKSASITLTAGPHLVSLSLNPTTVKGGASSTGTVTLSAVAPASGRQVHLSDNSGSITTPASVTVAGGASGGSFNVSTSGVTATATRTVSASMAGVTKTANLTLTP